MTQLTHNSTPFYFRLSTKDRIFAIVVIAIILIAVTFLVSDPQKPAFDVNAIQKSFIPTLSLPVLSALMFACIYAYILFQNSSFLFIALCWLANLVYTIFSRWESNEQQMYVTFVVALAADIPLLLSGFNEKQRKWWLPLPPIAVIIFSIAFYNLTNSSTPSLAPSVKLLTLYIFGPLASAAILFWTAYALYFRGILGDSIKHTGAYSLTFLILGILQLPFTLKSFCYFNFMPSWFCQYNVSILSATKAAALCAKVANLLIVFFVIKDALTGLKSAKEQLKIKGEFEELGFFAASIEHELRNPLEVIGGEIDYLKGKIQGEELQSRFAVLERQLSRMSVAADIINVLRAKRTDILRKIKPVPVLHHVNQAIKYVKKELSQQTVNIFFRVEEHTNQLIIEADPSLLEQCFVNLLKNSIEALNRSKKSGEIVIEIFLKEKIVVAVSFRDNGNGFIIEDIPQLIDPTYTKKPLSTTKSNRGLGLFVCDRIIKLHEGQMTFANHKNGGAIVILEFPRYVTKKMQKEAMG